MKGVEKGFARVNGADLYYEVAGEGDPVVLIHGFTLETRMWDDQFDVLAARYRVLRFDLRGFGRSSLPDGASYVHHDDIAGLLDRRLPVRPARIIGSELCRHSAPCVVDTDKKGRGRQPTRLVL